MHDIMENWHEIAAPDAPRLKAAAIDPARTALLVLDLQQTSCNADRRPRCVATLPGIRRLIAAARAHKMGVIHSLTSKAEPSDILPDVAPLPHEPVVKSSVDKFFNTDLEAHLEKAQVDTVIIVGTAAEGAVLHTAAGAAMRGFDLVIPVDGLSSSFEYAEQYTLWHLAHSPGTQKRTTLTRLDLISLAPASKATGHE